MTRPEAWRYLVEFWKVRNPGSVVTQEDSKEGSLRVYSAYNGQARQVWLWAQQQYLADMPEEEYPLVLATGAGGNGGNSELARDVMRARLKEVGL